MADVDIVLPDGGAATVPEEDLSRALAAGATVPTSKYAPGSDEAAYDTTLGQFATGVLGAGRVATGGLSDLLFSEAANIAGGEQARQGVLRDFRTLKEVNPGADALGEVGGLLYGAGVGGGITAAGEGLEAGLVSKLGTGFLGKVGASAGRGALEASLFGAERSITEDVLGDHELNGQKLAMTAGGDALLGAGIGAGTGAIGYGLGRLFGRRQVAGALASEGGAARELVDDAATKEGLIGRMMGGGMTSEQAAGAVDELQAAAKGAAAEGQKGVGLLEAYEKNIVKPVLEARAGGNPEMQKILDAGYADIRKGVLGREARLEARALDTADALNKLHKAESEMNRIGYRERPELVSKLVDTTKGDVARDAYARMLQETEKRVSFLESLTTKGNKAGDVVNIRKDLTDAYKFLATLSKDESGRITKLKPKEIYELNVRLNALKQNVGRAAGPGKGYGLTDSQKVFRELHDVLRQGLEDESVWGRAGAAQRVGNAAFSTTFEEAGDFDRMFSRLGGKDDTGWAREFVASPQKIRDGLLKKAGSEVDGADARALLEAKTDRIRQRIKWAEEFADMTPETKKVIDEARGALKTFATTLEDATNEAKLVDKLNSQALVERESPGLLGSGLLSVAGDIMTKPLTTAERLAGLGKVIGKIDKGIADGLENLAKNGGKAKVLGVSVDAKKIAADIAKIREIAASPERLAGRVSGMFRDLEGVAPKTLQEARATATRALTFLAREAPEPLNAKSGPFGTAPKELRYSDAQLASWQAKREAALGSLDGRTAPETLLSGLSEGRLNRDAIRTIEAVSPRLFAEIQQTARDQIARMQAEGKLDKLTLAQQASIASLLKVPPGRIWEPDFMLLMQSAKSYGQYDQQNRAAAAPMMGGTSGRAIKLDTSAFLTDAQKVEGG